MWTCPGCGRIFDKEKQPHSCKKVPLSDHFANKDKAKELFDFLVGRVNAKIGPCKIISIPCCVHLFGTYDFLAALPKRDGLEIRFALDHELKSPRITQRVPLSQTNIKYCLHVHSKEEIDEELLGWLNQSYHLKDK
jgi:hypothetical protein